ncbi:MAG: restriction endonuclease subunit S, partial [Lachnospiraceae bacterium]|nr:restriction endonuclease subunit S [Lachnospiraceae bacterium]
TGISRGVRQANISNKDILNLVVPIPPMDLQEQFADFVHQVDKSKVAVLNISNLLHSCYHINNSLAAEKFQTPNVQEKKI